MERVAAVSILAQFGVLVWLTSGPRQKNVVQANIFLFFLMLGLEMMFIDALNAYGWRFGLFRFDFSLGWILIAGGAWIVWRGAAGKPSDFFGHLLASYRLGFAVSLGVTGLVLVLAARGDALKDTFRYMILGAALLNDVTALLFLTWMPGRAELARFFAGFAVPGLGHLLRGQRVKALFFFLSLSALYVSGLALTSFRMVGREDNPFYWYGQFFSGFSAVTVPLLPEGKARLPDGLSYLHFDPGLLYVCASALLNYVVALNVFDLPQAPGVPAEAREGASA